MTVIASARRSMRTPGRSNATPWEANSAPFQPAPSTEIDPSAGEDVERGDLLREHGGIPVVVGEHEHAQPHPLGHGRDRSQRRDRSELRAEVIGQGYGVPALALEATGELAPLLAGRRRGHLHPETEFGFRHAAQHYAATNFRAPGDGPVYRRAAWSIARVGRHAISVPPEGQANSWSTTNGSGASTKRRMLASSRSSIPTSISGWRDPLRYTPEDYLADGETHRRGHGLRTVLQRVPELGARASAAGGRSPICARTVGLTLDRSTPRSTSARRSSASLIWGRPNWSEKRSRLKLAAGEGRLRAVRPELYSTDDASTALLRDERWDQWAAALQRNELLLEAWVSYRQLPDLTRLATRYPELGIVVNHLGGPVGAGLDDVESSDMRTVWLDGMRMLSAVPERGRQARRHGDERVRVSPLVAGRTAHFERAGRHVAAVDRTRHRTVRPRSLHVREQLPGRRTRRRPRRSLELLQDSLRPYSNEDRDWLCRKTAARTYRLDA